jgi:alkanesulfonate monooxygenase SsuD/methylene tetrahydromethanopterin reductase-like flavin-dependent oxidoreductase (luciferase family)
MTTLGATFRPQLPPERLRSIAQAADEAGVEEIWLWEDCFLEGGIAAAAAALAWTRRVPVCVGILPAPLRNVALTAMETATIARMFPGRFGLGIGHGVQDWMGQVGARPESPLTLLREYADALRGLLSGDEVTTVGRYVTLDAVRLDWPPLNAVPIWAAGEGPKTLRLTGEVADGTILTGGTNPDAVRHARTLIDEGRAASGRLGHHRVVVYVPAAFGAGAEERLEVELRRWGLDPADEVGVAGRAEQVADGVRRWVDAGADTVVLQPAGDDPDPEAFMHVVGSEVRPLLA